MSEFNKNVGGRMRPKWNGVIVSRETLERITNALDELRELKQTIQQIHHYEVYPSLSSVTDPQSNVLYLIGPTEGGPHWYEEYAYLTSNGEFKNIGRMYVDFSNLVTTAALEQVLASYATKTNLTEITNDLQGQINAIVADKAVVGLSTAPGLVFVGVESSISLTATTNTGATSIKIKKGDTELATGGGMSLSGTDTITPAEAGNTAYTAEFTIAGIQKTATKNVVAVYPVLYGAGDEYTDAQTQASIRTAPAGTYSVTVPNDGDNVFFVVPRTMKINSAKMSGFDFPLQAPVEVEIDGVEYKYYQSANTYNAGTLNIVIS